MQNIDDLNIPKYNWIPHQDIQDEIDRRRNGLFIFCIKIVNGEITDYMPIDNAKYDFDKLP